MKGFRCKRWKIFLSYAVEHRHPKPVRTTARGVFAYVFLNKQANFFDGISMYTHTSPNWFGRGHFQKSYLLYSNPNLPCTYMCRTVKRWTTSTKICFGAQHCWWLSAAVIKKGLSSHQGHTPPQFEPCLSAKDVPPDFFSCFQRLVYSEAHLERNREEMLGHCAATKSSVEFHMKCFPNEESCLPSHEEQDEKHAKQVQLDYVLSFFFPLFLSISFFLSFFVVENFVAKSLVFEVLFLKLPTSEGLIVARPDHVHGAVTLLRNT